MEECGKQLLPITIYTGFRLVKVLLYIALGTVSYIATKFRPANWPPVSPVRLLTVGDATSSEQLLRGYLGRPR